MKELEKNIELLNKKIEREITARKRAEQILEEKSRELYLANCDLQKHAEQLKENQARLVQSEKMASLGQLAAGVAHEINNPVGFIMSNIATLTDYVATMRKLLDEYKWFLENSSDQKSQLQCEKITKIQEDEDIDYILADVQQLLTESSDGTQRVKEIVQNLKSFARIDEGDVKDVTVNECIEGTLKIIWNELKYKCQVYKKFSDVPVVLCNPGEINQVFLNLLMNALQAIEKHGDIHISTELSDDHRYVVTKISDTGCGISPENLSKLFDPFFTTKAQGEGTGLGLAISHGIIQKHGGFIDVESAPGEGTTFEVYLPLKSKGDSNGSIDCR